MVEVISFKLDVYAGYIEGNKVYINPTNIESIEGDVSDEKIYHIQMVSGNTITSNRKALSDITESMVHG